MKKDLKEISTKTEKELRELLSEKRAVLFNHKLDKSQIKLKNTSSIFNTRKEIARILTLLTEKELLAKETALKAVEVK